MRQHNLHFNTKNALSKENVANGHIDVLLGGVAAVDHQPVDELHRLGSLPTKFPGNDHLAALGARLHDESQDAVAGASDGQTADQLVTERLGLSDRAETASCHLFGVELDGAIGIVEALLHDGSELTDALAFVAQYVLRARGENDDFRARRRHAHLQAGSFEGDRGRGGEERDEGKGGMRRGGWREAGRISSTPLYPSSANSRVKNSFNSALKTPSWTNFRFLDIWTGILNNILNLKIHLLHLKEKLKLNFFYFHLSELTKLYKTFEESQIQ